MRFTPVFFITAFLFFFSLPATSLAQEATPFTVESARTSQGLPLYFIENQGQLDDTVSYYLKGRDQTLYFTERGITFVLAGDSCKSTRPWSIALDFLGAEQGIEPTGIDPRKAVFNYFKGGSTGWKTDLPTFSKLLYKDLWPGIDLVLSGTERHFKQEFVVQPGADPSKVRLAYRGATGVTLTEHRSLMIQTPSRDFEDQAPVAYQVIDGRRCEVGMDYLLEDGSGENGFPFAFEVGEYDPTKPLILDPAIVMYCGLIGGSSWESGNCVAVDEEGCAYFAGESHSEFRFPVTTGPDLTWNGSTDAFVAKVSKDGSELIYCGFLGGGDGDYASDIAIDDQGCVYLTGITNSADFPVLVGPDLTFNQRNDVFVTKLDAAGTSLIYSGFIGGVESEKGKGIALDSAGCVYIAGYTESDETTFPVKVGPAVQMTSDLQEGFVAKVNAQGSELIYCGYVNLSRFHCRCDDIALDHQGGAIVVGETFNWVTGMNQAYAARVEPSGKALSYTRLIGNILTNATAVAVDEGGFVYIVGDTGEDFTCPFGTMVGPDLTYNGGNDAFIAKLSPDGKDTVFAGFIGGSHEDSAYDIALDHEGNAYVVGYTRSADSSFPVAIGPDLSFNGEMDGFIAKVKNDGTSLDYCGYIGGDEKDGVRGVALDDRNNAYVTGWTRSSLETFPLTVGPLLEQNYPPEYSDAFVGRISMALETDGHTLPVRGGTIEFYLNAHQDRARRNYILLGSLSGSDPGTVLPGGSVTLPLNVDSFTEEMFGLLNSSIFRDFMGEINTRGEATAVLVSPPLDPALAGTEISFAYCLLDPFDFASNAAIIELVP